MAPQRLAILGGLFVFVVALPARAGDTLTVDLRERLERSADGDQVAAIVRLRDHAAPAFGGGRSRTELIRTLRADAEGRELPIREYLAAHGAPAPISLWLIGGLAITTTAETLREIAHRSDVASVDLDRTFVVAPPVRRSEALHASERTTASTLSSEWNVDAIHAPALWSAGYTGTGIVVATLDSGVDRLHQDLAGRWRGGSNSWFDPNGQHPTPFDATGHGTQVMGILVGGALGGTSIGVAPGARWIAAKIFDDSGVATPSDIHQAFQWVLDPDGNPSTDDGADVVNCSWGLETQVNQCILEFEPDLEALKTAGVAVVFAAGNAGPSASSSVSPANNPEGFEIGFVGSNLAIDLSSSRGPSACGGGIYPNLVAPGVDVKTADLTLGGVFPDSYAWATGSSVGAPHVAGALALLKQAAPGATIHNLEAALLASATDLGSSGPDPSYGYGLIDVVAAHTSLANLSFCRDLDGDGRASDGGLCGPADCDDTTPLVWKAPGEVRALTFQADRRTIVWTAPLDPGGAPSALRYDALRSTLAFDFVTASVCIASDNGADSVATDAANPDPAQTFHYLVRAENACPGGVGTLGRRSSGTERGGATCP